MKTRDKHPPRWCANCQGRGTVLVDPRDRRKGERTCPNCGGRGST